MLVVAFKVKAVHNSSKSEKKNIYLSFTCNFTFNKPNECGIVVSVNL